MTRFAFVVGAVLLLAGCGSTGGSGSCGPSNCTGCCFNDSCQPGTTAAGCGSGGGTCSACSGSAICKSNQACGADPSAKWKVQPVSAALTLKNGGADWDIGGGAPDPFVSLFCPRTASSETTHTNTVSDVFSATWSTTSGAGCVMTAADLMSTGFSFIVYDEDVTTDDQVTGLSPIAVTEAMFASGYIDITGSGAITSMRINLVKQ